jgi:hypothetical protein
MILELIHSFLALFIRPASPQHGQNWLKIMFRVGYRDASCDDELENGRPNKDYQERMQCMTTRVPCTVYMMEFDDPWSSWTSSPLSDIDGIDAAMTRTCPERSDRKNENHSIRLQQNAPHALLPRTAVPSHEPRQGSRLSFSYSTAL